MRDIILEVFERIIAKILSTVWFFIRPVVYLYLVWASMKIVAFFH